MKKHPSAPSSGGSAPLSGLLSSLPPELLTGLLSSLTGKPQPSSAAVPPPAAPSSSPSSAQTPSPHGREWTEGPPNPDFPNPREHAFRDLLLRHETLSRRIDRENGR